MRSQPLLTDFEKEEVDEIWSYRNFGPHDVVINKFRIEMKAKSLKSLQGLNWLDDEIINFYMEMINDRSKAKADSHGYKKVWATNTFFFPTFTEQGYPKVRRWTKRNKIDVFSLDYVVIPVHLQVHWTCAIVDLTMREITFVDSMGGHGDQYCREILKYLEAEHKDKKGAPLPDPDGWKCLSAENNPQQDNGSDCGVFTCCMGEHVARAGFHQRPNFSCRDMKHIRKKIVVEIKQGELLS